MRRIVIALTVLSVMLAGCTGSGVVAAHRYSAYGLVNKDDNQNPNIHYRISVWNCVLAVIFVESVVVPVVVVGWQLWVPLGLESKHDDPNAKGRES